MSSAINLIRSLLLFVASIIFPPLALILNWDSIRQGMEEAGGFLPWAYEQLKAVISIPLKLLGIDPAAFWESVDAALLWLQTKWQQFKAFFATPLKLLGLGVDIFQQSFDNIIAWVQTKWQVFKQSGAALWQAFCDGLKSVLNAPVDLVKQGVRSRAQPSAFLRRQRRTAIRPYPSVVSAWPLRLGKAWLQECPGYTKLWRPVWPA